jgi:hypothetical protein
LTFLRAYDLSALNQTCTFYCNPDLVHAVIAHFADEIYPSQWTNGLLFCSPCVPIVTTMTTTTTSTTTTVTTPTTTTSTSSTKPGARGGGGGGKKASSVAFKPAQPSTAVQQKPLLYTFQHLRNMELLVVARVLNSPEPSGNGFFVSKSWCKTALKWLEVQQQEQQELQLQQQQQHHASNNKKLSKKKQRLRNRKLSDAHPPWPNANSDLLCEHDQLQRCSNGKSARARRRLLDKQAWKILKKLYPDSTPIDSVVGECLQCRAEAETTKKNAERQAALMKLERQGPVLDNAILRNFYLRRNGVPAQALVENDRHESSSKIPPPTAAAAACLQEDDDSCGCPLKEGSYVVLPRAWCYAWRRYIKTGELPTTTSLSLSSSCTSSPPPDASCLLCHKHRLALLPPHLEAYLYGEAPELIDPPPVVGRVATGVAHETGESSNIIPLPFARAAAAAPDDNGDRIIVPGQGPDPEALRAMRLAGLNDVEVSRQLSLLQQFQDQRRAAAAAAVAAAEQEESAASVAARRRLHNDRLDRENHTVVEIVTAQEYACLEDLWNKNKSTTNGGGSGGATCNRAVGFQLAFDVDTHGCVRFLTTSPCRACDATGRSNGNSAAGYFHHHHDPDEDHRPETSGGARRSSKKNRGRGWVAKEASVEY